MESKEPKEFSPEWFDWSSQMWMANKKKKANCTYVYICKKGHDDNKPCHNRVHKQSEYCWFHRSLAKTSPSTS